jgi:hypothetical protein
MRLLALLLPLAAFAQAPQSPEALARRFVSEVWIEGKAERAANYLTDPYVITDPRLGMNLSDPVSRQIDRARQWCVVHNDCGASTIDAAIASGDRVAIFWTLRLSPKTLWTRALAAVFGKAPASCRVVSVFTVRGGRIAELSIQRDDYGMYYDLGYINAALVLTWAVAGAAGMLLIWLLMRRKRARSDSEWEEPS